MARFALIAAVDWSAAATPGPARPGEAPQAAYFRTRRAALERLLGAVDGDVLVGFDFPFGTPAGSGLGGGRALAARLAALVEDRADGGNNRFAVAARLNAELNGGRPGPFWGCPPGAETATLPAKKSGRCGRPFADWRQADARLRSRGIQSCWKLYARGAVGGQMLLGLAAVHRLLTSPAFGARCRLWPFETGWDRRLDGVILAEVWPSLFDFARVDHPIRDARQVIAACDWLRTADSSGELRRALAHPAGLDAAGAAHCLAEEGWILGLA